MMWRSENTTNAAMKVRTARNKWLDGVLKNLREGSSGETNVGRFEYYAWRKCNVTTRFAFTKWWDRFAVFSVVAFAVFTSALRLVLRKRRAAVWPRILATAVFIIVFGGMLFAQCGADSAMFDERSGLQFGYCLAQLFLRVHHDRAVPCNRLLDRLARYQKETDTLVAGLDSDLVAAVEEHQRGGAVIVGDLGDRARRNVLIPRVGHLQR